MSLKRKREADNDQNEFGSPSKKQKSITITLNDIHLSPSTQQRINSMQHKNTKSMISSSNDQQNDMDGDDENDEEDSDINIDGDDVNDINRNNNKNKKKKRKKLKRRKCVNKDIIKSSQEQKIEDINYGNHILVTPPKHLYPKHLSIQQSICHSTESPSIQHSPINITNIQNSIKKRSKTCSSSLILTSPPQRASNLNINGMNNNSVLSPMDKTINCLNSPSRIKIFKLHENGNKLNILTTPSTPQLLQKKKKKKIRKAVKNSIFWQEIDKLDVIIPTPADDLCDRHLIIIHLNSSSDEENEENEEKEEEEEDIAGLEDSDYESLLLPNTNLNASSFDLLQSMNHYEYRIMKIANYALSIKSEYFRNLLSKKSSFIECEEDLVQIKINRYYGFALELLLRLLHINQLEIDQYLIRIQNHETLIQLLILIDQYQIKHIGSFIMKRLKFIASRSRPKQIHIKKIKEEKYTLPVISDDNGGNIESDTSILDDSDKENEENQHHETDNNKSRKSQKIKKRKKRKKKSTKRRLRLSDDEESSFNDDDDDDDISEDVDNRNNKYIHHIIPGFDPLFDNGGMTLLEVSNLLLISDNFLCLKNIKEIGKYALRKRYKKLRFNNFGIVDFEFRELPYIAINIILKGNEFCSWNENDIFLACTQWAAYPLHCNDEDIIHCDGDKRYTMNPYDNKQEIVHKRFNKIYENIRYHLLDNWFIDSIVRNYEPIQFNNKALLKILNVSTKSSLCSNGSDIINNPRYKDINKFFQRSKSIRPIPTCSNNSILRENINILNNNDNNLNYNDWQTFISRNLSETDLYRRHSEYDKFLIIFNKRDLINLSIGNRLTSPYMVWHGIIFALDLVRKENISRGRGHGHGHGHDGNDSVGVFLYCQGIECIQHIWIKYSLKTINHDHALQCSDYKMMQLNFQKGNGSRDFFGCSWQTFLNTYFDTNNQLKFKLTFIDAK